MKSRFFQIFNHWTNPIFVLNWYSANFEESPYFTTKRNHSLYIFLHLKSTNHSLLMCEGKILETIYHHNLVNPNTKHFSSSYASVHFFYTFCYGNNTNAYENKGRGITCVIKTMFVLVLWILDFRYWLEGDREKIENNDWKKIY